MYTNPLGMAKKIKLPESALDFFRQQGKAGGLKRSEMLTAEERSDQARKAVQARWAKQKALKSKEPLA